MARRSALNVSFRGTFVKLFLFQRGKGGRELDRWRDEGCLKSFKRYNGYYWKVGKERGQAELFSVKKKTMARKN